jgi:hypothetical protein
MPAKAGIFRPHPASPKYNKRITFQAGFQGRIWGGARDLLSKSGGGGRGVSVVSFRFRWFPILANTL